MKCESAKYSRCGRSPHICGFVCDVFPFSGRMQQLGVLALFPPALQFILLIVSESGHELNLCKEQCRSKCKVWEMLISWVFDGLWTSFP